MNNENQPNPMLKVVIGNEPPEMVLAIALDEFHEMTGRCFGHVHFERDAWGNPIAFWIGAGKE